MARSRIAIAFLVIAGIPAPLWSGEPFRFPEAKHGAGDLKYRKGIPVLTVSGTPAEIGEQVGAILGRPCARLMDYPKEALAALATQAGAQVLWPRLTPKCARLLENFPPDKRQEFEAL